MAEPIIGRTVHYTSLGDGKSADELSPVSKYGHLDEARYKERKISVRTKSGGTHRFATVEGLSWCEDGDELVKLVVPSKRGVDFVVLDISSIESISWDG